VFVIAIVGASLGLAVVAALLMRPLVASGIGIGLFVAAGAWVATRPDEQDRETLNGPVGWYLAAVWILLPWLVGVVVGSLIRLASPHVAARDESDASRP
jgi:hypothetical protein